MYEQWSPSPRPRQTKKKNTVIKRRFHQLIVSFCCFLLVFSGSWKENTTFFQEYAPSNLQESFTGLGSTISDNTAFVQGLTSFLAVFLTAETSSQSITEIYPPNIQVFSPAQQLDQEDTTTHFYEDSLALFASPQWTISSTLWSDLWETPVLTDEAPQNFPSDTPLSPPEEVVMPIGTILQSEESLLPETHTMDYLYLGDTISATPLCGSVTSSYGMRVDPITGDLEELHSGLDIRGSEGTPIVAWRDAVVEKVGETRLVGLYVRLNHGDGITSFYAHCSEILVKEGDTVMVGEEIAKVGATGLVTGPHLHFEIRWNDQYLNPIYYLQKEDLVD